MRTVCVQQLLTMRKVLWAVKSAAVGEGVRRERSDLDRFIVDSKLQGKDAGPHPHPHPPTPWINH